MKTKKLFALVLPMVGAIAFGVIGCKTEDYSFSPDIASSVKPYPLTKCVVSGESIDPAKAYTFVRNGQEIKLCCKDCLAEFDKDPNKFLAKISEAK
jgi:hypothetical protein